MDVGKKKKTREWDSVNCDSNEQTHIQIAQTQWFAIW